MEGHAAAVFENGDHGRRTVVVFTLARILGLGRREDLAAQAAAQSAALEDRSLKGGSALDPDHRRGQRELVDLSLHALRAPSPAGERWMGYFHQAAAGVAGRTQPSMALAGRLGLGFFGEGPVFFRVLFGEELFGGLGWSTKKIAHEPLDGSRAVLDGLAQAPESFGHPLYEFVICIDEGPTLHPIEEFPHLGIPEFDAFDLPVLAFGLVHGDGRFPCQC